MKVFQGYADSTTRNFAPCGCCGAMFLKNVNDLPLHNKGFTFAFKGRTKLFPEDGTFRYVYVKLGKKTLVIKERAVK